MKILKIALSLSIMVVSILIFIFATTIYAMDTKRIPPPEEWVGKKIIFLSDDGQNPYYKSLVGKTAEIIGVKKRKNLWSTHNVTLKLDESKKIVRIRAYGNTLKGVAFLSEMEGAMSFVGKTVWNKRNPTVKDMDGWDSIRCQRRIKNLEEVVIKDIKWGRSASSPLRFIFETKDGLEGYWEGSYSRLNDTLNRILLPFDENWYFEDPRKTYPDWPEWTWKAIEDEKIYEGMTKEMVLISWGEPDSIHHFEEDKELLEQWTYINTYLYFKDGKLIHIQDNEVE